MGHLNIPIGLLKETKLKFATIAYESTNQPVLIDNGRAWLVRDLIPNFDGDLVQLIANFDALKGQLTPQGAGLDLSELTILAPLQQLPRNIICVGKNYHAHAKEFSESGFDSSAQAGEHSPDHPVVFTKPATTVIGTGDPIPAHADVTQQMDYEAEFAVIIGKAGRAIRKEDAMKHVFGYTIINDVTARDLQKKHKQWFLGKSLDGFCPMGPVVVTADELDHENLDIRCWVNGELRQDANTKDLIFDIPTLIETLSAGIELLPGDVIATGTPEGVGIGFNPPKFLQAGDEVEVEIQGIGRLKNRVA